MDPKRLAQFLASASEAPQYAVPAGRYAIVKNVVVANNSAAPVALHLSIVPSGQAAGPANRIVPGSVIPALGTVALDLMQVMAAGDFISAMAGTSGVLAVTISGLEEEVA